MTSNAKRAGTPGGGTMLKSGSGPYTDVWANPFKRTSTDPICEVTGHSDFTAVKLPLVISPTVHWSTVVGLPTNPGGRSITTSFAASTGVMSPMNVTGLFAVLKSSEVEAE